MNIVGYLIVENAKHYNPYPSVLGNTINLCVRGKTYSGIARQCNLYNLQDNKFNKILDRAKEVYSNTLMYYVIEDYNDAKLILKQLNLKIKDKYELIGIYSKVIAKFVEIKTLKNKQMQKIGIDIDVEYAGFVIQEELFASYLVDRFKIEFTGSQNKLNKYGLFDSLNDAEDFIKLYIKIQKKRKLELIKKADVKYIEVFV